jgi:AraC-like DNA-binding protein
VTGRSITGIRLGAGFGSAAHFSRMFRHHYGASPRAWRALGGKITLHSAKE